MKVQFESKGGFNNALSWMKRASNIQHINPTDIAKNGESSLRYGTPEDTGETADGWKSEVSKSQHSITIAWTNVAHPESEVNVAKLIEFGHGTRNGGYVTPRPYIKQSMAPVWKKLDRDVEELMK